MPKPLLYLFLLCLPAQMSAQDSSGSFTFYYANDVLNGTDRYFTQGLYLDLSLPKISRTAPFYKTAKNSFSSVRSSFRLRQDVFTPSSINADTIQTGDRPYTATLTLSQHNTYTNTKNLFQLYAALSVGIIGPAAGGKGMQNGIHRAIGNSLPMGWQYQLSGAPVIQLDPGINKGLFSFEGIELNINAKARIGTVYQDIGTALMLRFGNNASLYQTRNKKIRYCFYLEHGFKYVAYNGTLQGAVFSQNNTYTIPASGITRVVWNNQVGFELTAGNMSLNLSQTWLSKEFNTGLSHAWNSISAGIAF